jgi:signal transduction histidine kinase
MKMLTFIQQRLGLKLFLSYVVILLVGGAVLLATAQFYAASTQLYHTERMEKLVAADPALEDDLRTSFTVAVDEIMVVAALAAFFTAVGMSIFLTGRIVGSIQQMQRAGERIASGDYSSRIPFHSQDELGDLAHIFNQMAETIEQAEQRRLELIGNVSHELRTPLSGIKVTLQGLLDDVLPCDPPTLMQAQREVARLERLVQDLQHLSRVEANQITLNLRPVKLAERITTAVGRLRPQYEDKGVALVLDLPPDELVVQADRDRIMQVLVNLLGNALQYTPAGGQVTITAWREPRAVFVAVKDTGIGIPPEHLPHIFERFYRVEKSRARTGGGTGVGLTIARHFVEDHGGRIWATSPGLGQGSTFMFSLPLTS